MSDDPCFDDFDDDESDPDEEFLDFDCRMMADGQCPLAGTEECDWECPRSRGLW
jgi:hypothetical protein